MSKIEELFHKVGVADALIYGIELEQQLEEAQARIKELEEVAAVLDNATQPFSNVDKEWLYSVLRYADKNPDMFFQPVDGLCTIDTEDIDFLLALYALPQYE